jgi:phage-related protein
MAFVGSAFIQVIANTSQFDNGVQRAIDRLEDRYGDAGKNIGILFGKKVQASFKDLDRAAVQTYQSFNALLERSYYVQGALAAFIPVISAVVSGFVALVAQVGAATPALIVLPSIFSAMIQGMMTLKLAFGGIGKALQQMGTGAGDAAKKLKELQDKALKTKDALIRAEWRHKDAQDALNRSYAVAAERIQQLNFDAEDAALAQQRAAMALEGARESLKRVQDLPPNSRARKEAELSFKEADLNYRRAVDRNKDLQEEQKETTNNGEWTSKQQVENSDEVVDASRRLLDAEMSLADAMKDRREAVEKLKKAEKGIFDDVGGANALGKLTEAQRKFAEFINGLRPHIDDLKAAAGEKLFGPLTEAIQNLVDNFKEPLITMLRDTGGALGEVAKQISNVVTEKDNIKNFEIVTQTNVQTIKDLGETFGNLYDSMLTLLAAASPLVNKFTDWLTVITDGWKNTLEAKQQTGALTEMFDYAGEVAANLGDIIGNLVGAFMNIGRAAAGRGSGGEMLVTSIEEWSQRFEDFTAKLLANGELEEFFRKVSDVFLKVLGYIKDIGKAFLKSGGADETGKSVDSMGGAIENLIGAFEKIVAAGPAFANFLVKFTDFIEAVSESESIKLFFGVVSTAFSILNGILGIPVIGTIFKALAAYHALRLGLGRLGITATGTGKYLKGAFLSTADTIGKAGKRIKGAFGIMQLATSSSGRAFLRQYFSQWVKGSKIWAHATRIQGKLTSGTKALGSGMKAIGPASKKASGAISTFAKSMGAKIVAGMKAFAVGVKAVGVAIKAAFVANPVGMIILAIVALIAIVVVMYKKFGWFRDFVHAVWDGIKVAAKYTWEAIKIAFDFAWNAIKDAIDFTWNSIIKPIFEAFGVVFGLVWEGIKLYYTTAWSIITAGISFAWNSIIKPIFEAFGVVFGLVWEGIKIAFDFAWNAIKDAIDFTWNSIIKPIFEAFGTIFGKVWSGIKIAFEGAWGFITRAIDGAKSVFSKIGDAISAAFKAAINFIIRAWNKIEFKIPGFKIGPIGYSGFTLGLPNIPELAEGGIINPTPGGTLARIGEAGRAERVEPLDPDGLSKRDKAMISLLSGGGGGINITVNPSPGMDEVELANVVSRQLAFHMRRGVL